MELPVNLNDIQDVEDGRDLLLKILMENTSLLGAATLTELMPGMMPVMYKLPIRTGKQFWAGWSGVLARRTQSSGAGFVKLQHEPDSAPNTAKAPAISQAEGRPHVGLVAAVEPLVKRPRCRPPGSSTKRDAAAAAAQPVSVAMPGVPARNLASALEGDDEVAHKAEAAGGRTDPAEPAQDRTAIGQNSPLSDPDLAGAFHKPSPATLRPPGKNSAAAGPKLVPSQAINNPFADRSMIELTRLWATEVAKRGYSWSRKVIKRHNVCSSSEFTPAMLIDVLTNP